MLLLDRLASFLTDNEKPVWAEYIVAPSQRYDPTEGFVATEFGITLSNPTGMAVSDRSLRLSWLAEMLLQEGRYTEAQIRFHEALFAANTPIEVARARFGMGRTGLAMGAESSQKGLPEEAVTYHLLATHDIEIAASTLLSFARTASDGDAHAATELAVQLAHLSVDAHYALDVATSFERELRAEVGKRAFAELMRIRALGSVREYAAAIDASHQLATGLENTDDDAIQSLRALTSIDLAFYLACIGQPHLGLDHLDTIVDQYGSKYQHWITPVRGLVLSYTVVAKD